MKQCIPAKTQTKSQIAQFKENQQEKTSQETKQQLNSQSKPTQLLVKACKQIQAQLVEMGRNTLLSDKIVRLCAAVVKVMRNFKMKNSEKLVKLAKELAQLRRLLRINRLAINYRDLSNLFVKKQWTGRNLFDLFFKLIMTFTDFNDMLVYLMQLELIPEMNIALLKKNTMDFYFFECVLWTLQHCYQFYTQKHLLQGSRRDKKKLYIIKYIIDCITSHNDYSHRAVTMNLKSTSLLSLISSIFGLIISWK